MVSRRAPLRAVAVCHARLLARDWAPSEKGRCTVRTATDDHAIRPFFHGAAAPDGAGLGCNLLNLGGATQAGVYYSPRLLVGLWCVCHE